jgi:hypothetical protein
LHAAARAVKAGFEKRRRFFINDAYRAYTLFLPGPAKFSADEEEHRFLSRLLRRYVFAYYRCGLELPTISAELKDDEFFNRVNEVIEEELDCHRCSQWIVPHLFLRDCASKLVENTNALVEIERVLYVASVQKDFERQDARSLSSLNLQKRSNTEVLHFGDLHLDFILNTQTPSPSSTGWRTRSIFSQMRHSVVDSQKVPARGDQGCLAGVPACIGASGDLLHSLIEPS